MKRAVLSLLGLACLFSLSGQVQKNLNLISQFTFSADLNDVWGYVAPDGTEYALVGRFDGVSIVSLADPARPVEVADIPGQGSIWRDLKTYGEYAYVSHDDQPFDSLIGDGTLIIDLSDLPESVRFKDTVMAGIRYAHNVYVDDDVLYVAGTDNFNGGVVMFDLADPWNPDYLGAYTEHYVHDVYVRDNLAYTGEINDGQLSVVDVNNKANPNRLGSVTYPGGFTHNTWLNDAGDVCFTTDELGAAYLIAWDVSDPTAMYALDRIRSSLSDGRATPHNTHVFNDYLVTSYYKDGLHIVDASRPQNLIEVGYYDTSPMQGGGTDGCWGAYPFLPSGLVLATDIQEGLFVFRPTYTRGAYLEGRITDASNSNPINRAEVTLSQPLELIEYTDITGLYAVGSADDVDVSVTYAKYGYRPETEQVSLRRGILTEIDVILQPAQLITLSVEVYDQYSGQPLPDAEVLLVAPGDEQTFDYQTDASGNLLITDFLEGKYDLIAGKWGYVTNMVETIVDQNTPVIKIGLLPGYYDDFAFDYGWTTDGDADRGGWEWGEPIGSIMFDDYLISPEFDLENDFGPFCYVTENGSGEFFEHDVDRGNTILTSPVIDLSAYQEPVVEFSWWLFNFDANELEGGNDYLRAEATNDGTTWVQVFESTSAWRNSWRNEAPIRLNHFLTNAGSSVQIRFVTADDDPQNIVEAAVDRFYVYDQATVSNDAFSTTMPVKLIHGDGFIELIADENMPLADFTMLDMQGKQLQSGTLAAPRFRIQTDHLSPGVYLIRLNNDAGTRVSLKFFAQ